jgi:predicted RNA-binding Zn ribbon-like protein
VDENEDLLLGLLNSAPVVDGRATDRLDGAGGRQLARAWGGTGSDDELAGLRSARDALQAVVRGATESGLARVDRIVDGAVRTPRVTPDGVVWDLEVPDDDRLPVRAILAWSDALSRFPGRLRACANDECNLFLVDHSRPGTAKWCSMATCGNRMKARAYARRSAG